MKHLTRSSYEDAVERFSAMPLVAPVIIKQAGREARHNAGSSENAPAHPGWYAHTALGGFRAGFIQGWCRGALAEFDMYAAQPEDVATARDPQCFNVVPGSATLAKDLKVANSQIKELEEELGDLHDENNNMRNEREAFRTKAEEAEKKVAAVAASFERQSRLVPSLTDMFRSFDYGRTPGMAFVKIHDEVFDWKSAPLPEMWTCGDGKRVKISEMNDSHLFYALAKARRGEYPDEKCRALSVKALEREAAKRLGVAVGNATVTGNQHAQIVEMRREIESLRRNLDATQKLVPVQNAHEIDSLKRQLKNLADAHSTMGEQLIDARAKNRKLSQIVDKYQQTRAGLGLPPVEV